MEAVAVLQLRAGELPALRVDVAGGELLLRRVRKLFDARLADLRLAAAEPAAVRLVADQGRAIRRLVQQSADRFGPQGSVSLRAHHRQPDPHHADADDLFQAAVQRHPVGLPVRQIRGYAAAVAHQRTPGVAAGRPRPHRQHQPDRRPVGGAGGRLRQGGRHPGQRPPRPDPDRGVQRQCFRGESHRGTKPGTCIVYRDPHQG